VNESMHESVQNIKGIRLLAAAVGLLAGFGVGYLMAYFTDIAAIPPLFDWSVLPLLLPLIVLGVVILTLLARNPLSTSDTLKFVVYFWVPFFWLYIATYWLYWATRI
jgi:hypothetical protein